MNLILNNFIHILSAAFKIIMIFIDDPLKETEIYATHVA